MDLFKSMLVGALVSTTVLAGCTGGSGRRNSGSLEELVDAQFIDAAVNRTVTPVLAALRDLRGRTAGLSVSVVRKSSLTLKAWRSAEPPAEITPSCKI